MVRLAHSRIVRLIIVFALPSAAWTMACRTANPCTDTTPTEPVAAAMTQASLHPVAPTTQSSVLPDKMNLVFIDDASTSYPPELRDRAREWLADQLEGFVQPGFRGAWVSEHWLTEDTAGINATLDSFTIPAIPLPPVRQ